MKRILLLLLLTIIIVGCSVIPEIYVDAPWKRIFEVKDIDLSKVYKLNVVGNSVMFPESADIVSNNLESITKNYLTRRGFNISGDEVNANIKIKYNTERYFREEAKLFIAQNTNLLNSNKNGFYSSIIGIYKNRNRSNYNKVLDEGRNEVFIHDFAFEVYDEKDDIIWRGETRWFDSDLNIASTYPIALKYLISKLPKTENPQINLPKVKEDSYNIYFDLNLRTYKFLCPALPYYISFNGYPYYFPRTIRDAEYMEGYRDMLLFSESAIPVGDDYENLMSSSLWSKAWMGGEYNIGGEKVFLIISLKGAPEGYRVVECKKATDIEKEKYLTKKSQYDEQVRKFLDYYIHE